MLLTLDRQTKRNEDDLKVTLEYISYILTHVTGDRNRQAVTAEVREERGEVGGAAGNCDDMPPLS